MGYRIPWNRLSTEERQRRSAASTAVEKTRRVDFKTQLAKIESTNTTAETKAKRAARARRANLDLIMDLSDL